MIKKNKGQKFNEKVAKEKLAKQKSELLAQLQTLSQQDPYKISGYSDENTQDDDAFEREGHTRVASLQEELNILLNKVKKALMRIEKGEYIFCEKCKKEIDLARLEAVPYATLCLHCEKMEERKK